MLNYTMGMQQTKSLGCLFRTHNVVSLTNKLYGVEGERERDRYRGEIYRL